MRLGSSRRASSVVTEAELQSGQADSSWSGVRKVGTAVVSCWSEQHSQGERKSVPRPGPPLAPHQTSPAQVPKRSAKKPAKQLDIPAPPPTLRILPTQLCVGSY